MQRQNFNFLRSFLTKILPSQVLRERYKLLRIEMYKVIAVGSEIFEIRSFRGFHEFWLFSRTFMTLKILEASIRESLSLRNFLISFIRVSLCHFLSLYSVRELKQSIKNYIIFCRKVIITVTFTLTSWKFMPPKFLIPANLRKFISREA